MLVKPDRRAFLGMAGGGAVAASADPLPWIGTVPGGVPNSGLAFFNFGAPDVRSVFYPTRAATGIDRGFARGHRPHS
jgi:hypothetical protein